MHNTPGNRRWTEQAYRLTHVNVGDAGSLPVARVVTRSTVDDEGLAAWLRPRRDLVLERDCGGGRFEAVEGPVREYARTVEVATGAGQRHAVTQTVELTLAVPYFGWLFWVPFRRTMGRPGTDGSPWWAPPARLDARAATVLGSLGLLAIVFGYLNTLFTQTITFAAEELGAGNAAQGLAGAVVRVGGLVALGVVAAADRHGRRTVLLWSAAAGCVLALTGAAAPTLAWLTVSQTFARAFATALLVLVAIVAAEEMPAGSRAYAVSLLAMASGLGAGVCVLSLRLADLGPRGWRLLYLVPVLGLPAVAGVRRRLPESRRFVDRSPQRAGISGHGKRLWLLGAAGLLTNVFIAPQSQFANRFLRVERGLSGGRIGVFSLATGTPAGIGIVVGGRLADTHGRRRVGAGCIAAGTVCTVLFFFSRGWAMWAWALVGTTVSDASIPALGVYGPELFPTSMRGRANGIVAVCALAGSAIGLGAGGLLADSLGGIGPAMAVLSFGPAVVAVLVLARYPETAGRELEDLNPEDR
ncbi:MAG: MFS transporter [Acidimicrobiales bacterium]